MKFKHHRLFLRTLAIILGLFMLLMTEAIPNAFQPCAKAEDTEMSFFWPVPANYRSLSQKYHSGHKALDINGMPLGKASVYAAHNGTVVQVYTGCIQNKANTACSKDANNKKGQCSPNWNSQYYTSSYSEYGGYECNYGFGNGVIIKDDVTNIFTVYAHMYSVSVERGDIVKKGDILGTVGCTGQSGGIHLHFGIGKNYIPDGGYYEKDSATWLNNNPNSTKYSDGIDYEYALCAYEKEHGVHNYSDYVCTECSAWQEDSVESHPLDKQITLVAKRPNTDKNTVVIRNGPYEKCNDYRTITNGTVLESKEYVVNKHGNTWYLLNNGYYIYEENIQQVTDTTNIGGIYFAPSLDPEYLGKESFSDDNAVVVLSGSKTSGVGISKTGIILYDAEGNGLKDYSQTSSVKDNSTIFHVWFDIKDELGLTLTPGTTYKYRMYAVSDTLNKTFTSDYYTFKTTGTAPAPDPKKGVSFSDTLDSFYESLKSIGRKTATVVKKIIKNSAAKISSVTVRLFSATGELLGEKLANINVGTTTDSFHVATEIYTELGMPLSPNTTYQYEYVVNTEDNNSYSSGKSSFTTQTAPEPQITFSEPTDAKYAKKAWVSYANAVVVKKLTKEYGTKVDRSGIVLMDANGSVIRDFSAPSISRAASNYFHIWFDINDELGVTLSPNTGYQYMFYVTVSGKNYYSPVYSFTTTSPTDLDISFSVPTQHEYVMKQLLTQDNACVVSKLTKPSGTRISQVGIVLYDANGNIIKDFSHSSSSSVESSYFHTWFNFHDELGVTLSPDTTYQYKFSALSNGQWYYSDMYSLTTPALGSAGIIFSEATDEEHTQHIFVGQTNAHVCKQVYKPAGMKPDYTGIEIYTIDGKLVSQHWHPSSISSGAGIRHIWFNITEELGVTLRPGTTYVYKFYLRFGNDYYYSPDYTFTTLLPDVLSIGIGDPVDWNYISRQAITDTNAVISKCIYKTFGMDADRVGVKLYDANGNFIKNADIPVEAPSQSDYFHVSLDFHNDLGFDLEPSTTYQYQFYVYAHDNTYYSDMWSFTTSGCTIYLNANGGRADREFVMAAMNEPIGELPVPIREGYIFQGWYTGMNSGSQVLANTTCTGNTTIFAMWKEAVHEHSYNILLSTEAMHPHRKTYACICGDQIRDEQIRYSDDCGFCSYDMMPEIKVTARDANSCTVEIVTTADEDFIFDGYNNVYVTSTTDGTIPEQESSAEESIVITGSELIQAKAWTGDSVVSRALTDGQPDDDLAIAESSVASLQIYKISFDAGDGTAEYNAAFFSEGELISALPDVTAPEGMYFTGWYTEDGEYVTKNSITALHEQTLYARYGVCEASDGLEYLLLADGCIITGYTGSDTVVSIPDSISETAVIEIGDAAFFQNTSISKVILPDTIERIGSQAFMLCENLTTINLPENLQSLGSNAFGGCSSLTDVTLPDTLKELDTYAFQNCTSITSITIPDSIEVLGDNVFNSCSSLESVVLPETITCIPDRMFAYCTALTSVNLPETITEIGDGAFSRCSNFAVALPQGLVRIGNNAFEYCGYETLVLPNSLAEIGSNAFWCNQSLTSLTLPDSLESFGDSCFSDCTQLPSVTIPSGWTTTGKSTFADCSALAEVILPDGLLVVDDWAFHNCDALVSIDIPDTVEYIGELALRHCESLESVRMPANLEHIGESAFYRCSKLKSLQIPKGVTELLYSFNFCSSLEEITIPASVTSIESDAFSWSPNLVIYTTSGSFAESYAIEKGIPYLLTDYIFVDDSTLSEDTLLLNLYSTEIVKLNVQITPNNASRKDVLWNSTDDTIAVVNADGFVRPIAEGTSTITCSTNDGSNVSSACEVLVRAYSSKLCLPPMLQSLKDEAFSGNLSIEYVEIPESLTTIGADAFKGCTNLACVEFVGSDTLIKEKSFADCEKLVFLCKSGSTAEAFAIANSIEYILMD